MSLWRWTALDLKRLFQGRGLILATLITPLIGLMIFASVVAPMLVSGEKLSIPYAICNEDGSEPVRQFVRLLTNAESLRELGTAYPVNDLQTGYELLESGRVSVLIHIPADFFAKISAGGDPAAYIIASQAHGFERSMVRMTVDGMLGVVGQAQNLLQRFGGAAKDAGANEAAVAALINAQMSDGIEEYMHRRAALSEGGALSPFGEYFPLQYYLSALFSVFAALAMLPSLYLSSSDLSGPVVKRGLLASKYAVAGYFCSRLLSGGALILLSLALLIPTGAIIQGLDTILGRDSVSDWAALAPALVLISFCFSAMSLLLGALIKRPRLALWCGFFAILAMAALSGALVAEGALPGLLAEIGRWTPLKIAMNLLAGGLFSLDPGRYANDMLRLAIVSIVFALTGLMIVYRKGAAA